VRGATRSHADSDALSAAKRFLALAGVETGTVSYFMCAFKAEPLVGERLANVICDIVPARLRNDTFHIKTAPTYLRIYGNKKAIPNLAIHDHELGSWLAIIGTPLLRLTSESHRLEFLDDFLSSPVESLRNKIDGHFAIFAYDARKDALVVATDFNNTTPIFYTVQPDGLLFSSNELPLAKFLRDEIDPLGFGQSIQLGVPWQSRTRFQNILKLLPCHVLTVDHSKQVHIEAYWEPRDEGIWHDAFDGSITRWGALLRESVVKFFDCSDRKPVLSDFTAGEDARLILAQCHALGIPFQAHVTGLDTDLDVIVAIQAAERARFELIRRPRHRITESQLLADAPRIGLISDSYLGFFEACTDYATEIASPLDDYNTVKYNGVPGGEAFRGSYYLRGKAIFPSMRINLDYKFFTRMKYLLDYHPALLRYPDNEFIDTIYGAVEDRLQDVKDFPIGTQIDHMLRAFQTCHTGLRYRSPLYMPLATNSMTRSIYWLAPHFKRGGRLTKACTEMLFPELAIVKTQNGVPTIRRTVWRQPIFLPEYIALARKISNGALSRLFKWKQANTWQYNEDFNSQILQTLFNSEPFSKWFLSSEQMITGPHYNPDVLNALLTGAKAGSCRYVPVLGRIIAQELALRWVYGEGLSQQAADEAMR
jgi:hypothetical protein